MPESSPTRWRCWSDGRAGTWRRTRGSPNRNQPPGDLGMTSAKDSWLDQDAGPVVRPYAVTKGRTIPAGDMPFGLIDVVVATDRPPADAFRPSPEHRQLLRMC